MSNTIGATAARNLRRVANLGTRRVAIHFGRTLPMFPVLGYPKSGTTWLCQLMAESLALPFAQFAHLPVAMPSVVHGHWRYHKGLRNVTFTVRDGRDTMVSFYFFCKLIHDAGEPSRFRRLYPPATDLDDVRSNLPRFIEEIFRRPMGARDTWPGYNRSWSGRPGVVVTRYESLRRDPQAELARIISQHGLEPDARAIARAVDNRSMVRLTGRRDGEEDRSSFIRKGATGEWRQTFTDEACEIFADLAGDALVELGYEQSPAWRDWDRTSASREAEPADKDTQADGSGHAARSPA